MVTRECNHYRAAMDRARLACNVLDNMYPQPPLYPEDHPNGLPLIPPGGVELLVQCHKEHAADMYLEAAAIMRRCACQNHGEAIATWTAKAEALDSTCYDDGRAEHRNKHIDTAPQSPDNQKSDGARHSAAANGHTRRTA